jgi:chorismate dehydratase
MIEHLRVGCVPYLNAKPLLRYLPSSVVLREPSLLAQEFRQGHFDIALIPVVECLSERNVQVIDGLGIGCRGEVYSVLLAHEKPLDQVESIALDAASLTSMTLLRVLLAAHWKKTVPLRPDGSEADAQLLIGDRALAFRRKFPQRQITDLGKAWQDYTGLPFVFAVWALPEKSALSSDQINAFRDLSRKGLDKREELAKSAEEARYLQHWISYALGPREKESVRRFAQEINQQHLFSQPVVEDLVYV